MITVDASAVLAMLLGEPEGASFAQFLAGRGGVISPVNWWEAAVRMRGVNGAAGVKELRVLLQTLKIEISPINGAQANAALDAHVRFGRGNPAALNLGDCFAYALAQAEGGGLLFKGGDFPQTDIPSAL